MRNINFINTLRICTALTIILGTVTMILYIQFFQYFSSINSFGRQMPIERQTIKIFSTDSIGLESKRLLHYFPDLLGKEMGVLDSGYNLGDMFSMPVFRYWNINEWAVNGSEYVYTAQRAAIAFPYSIVGMYAKAEEDDDCGTLSLNRKNCDVYPNVQTLRRAVDMWGAHFQEEAEKARSLLSEKDHVLLIHLRSGDKSNLYKTFIKAVAKLADTFDQTIIMSGLHSDTNFADAEKKENQLSKDITTLMNFLKNTEVKLYTTGSADEGLYMMRIAKHLFVHSGGYSAIGAHVCNGTVYYSQKFGVQYNLTKFGHVNLSYIK